MIPSGLKKVHLKKAAAEIDLNGAPKDRESVHYDLVLRGKLYPPKYVISLAQGYATGEDLPARSFSAVEAKNYFIGRGYTVIDRRHDALQKVAPEDEESSFPEGAAIYRLHRHLERDGAISRKAKAKRLAETGKLECEVCQFDFVARYGSIGNGFIEAHHKTHVSKNLGTAKTKASDLALVCSNCHRMLHTSKNGLSIEELRAHVTKTRA
ncbi:HNH endonuclease [Polaromonas sp. OV174]|uniref:HNH endonuclease n=1 Tax=Polaromonas sp. OV174 TaxID=1855300 RepID=UPI0008ECAC95|nr:HNH endonuclease [Polaromonas sp. OV174]SFC57673.1 HNH endonuclease [Polaromonas sp. OV174]